MDTAQPSYEEVEAIAADLLNQVKAMATDTLATVRVVKQYAAEDGFPAWYRVACRREQQILAVLEELDGKPSLP
jgi:hypothetical protein